MDKLYLLDLQYNDVEDESMNTDNHPPNTHNLDIHRIIVYCLPVILTSF